MTAKTVMLVDDSRVARMMTRALVEKHRPGWAIGESASGEEAIAAAPALAPDFVLVDVNMPGIDGLATARQLIAICPRARISLLTANIQDAIRQQAEALGIGFLTKPLRDDALLAFLDGGR